MASRRIPVETWQMILRYAISVPVFFEANPVEAFGLEDFARYYKDESPYWNAERSRNALRRVSSSWNTYLKRFENKYVQIGDVVKGRIPVSAIASAIRLRFRPHRGGYSVEESLLERATLENEQEWPLEIIHIGVTSIHNIILQSGRVGRLKSISYAEHSSLQEMSLITPLHCEVNEFLPHLLQHPNRLSQLCSLSILTDNVIPLTMCNLPAPKHLSILSIPTILTPEDLLGVLAAVGKRLVTFFDRSELSDYLIPDEIWPLLPHIERFQTGLVWPTGPQLPASLHNLHLSLNTIQEYEATGDFHFPVGVLCKLEILSITLNEFWGILLMDSDHIMELWLDATDHGLTVRDASGQTFQDFVITGIRHRKTHDQGFLQSWEERYRDF